jgi:hypothetical protein
MAVTLPRRIAVLAVLFAVGMVLCDSASLGRSIVISDWNDGSLQGWTPIQPFGGLLAVDVGLGNPGALGIPHSRALPLLEKCIPGYRQLLPNTEIKQWPDVDAMASRSTVLIWVKGFASHVGVPRARKAQKGAQPLEDPWCMTCYGRGTVECPIRECHRGFVAVTRTHTVVKPNGGVASIPTQTLVKCKTCGGKGVPCANCNHGLERSLR